MTFDAEQSATYGTWLADVRDNVGALASWTEKDDGSGGAAELAPGDFFVLTTPAPAEDLYIGLESGSGGIQIQHGPDWDASGDTWNDQYAYDPFTTEEFYASSNINQASEAVTVFPFDGTGQDAAMAAGDAGSYWMEYVDADGFCTYWQRELGDGNDAEAWFGMAAINTAWDYTTAAAREASWVLGFGDTNKGDRYVHMSASGKIDGGGDPKAEVGNNTYEGRGMVNPDNNFTNYPATNTVIASTQYTNVEGRHAVIGDFQMWLKDESGSGTGHKDIIEDGGGTDIYTILKRSGTPNVAIRMD